MNGEGMEPRNTRMRMVEGVDDYGDPAVAGVDEQDTFLP